ncbi:hypothetical protein [Azospirillum aestuarii]|uniref:hypothetical protein n=1 Tax=Azospirillum aestuarii TaxID=2802052 RepID=UPI00405505B0
MSAPPFCSGFKVGDRVEHASDLVTLPAAQIDRLSPCSNGVVFAETSSWSAPVERIRLVGPDFAGMVNGGGAALPVGGAA